MKHLPTLLIDLVIYISIFPLLICVMLVTTLGTTLLLNLVPQFSEVTSLHTATVRTYRRAVLPTAGPTAMQISNLAVPTGQTAGASAEIQEQTVASVGPPAPAIVPNPVSRVVNADGVVPMQLYPQAQTGFVTTSSLPTDIPGFNSGARDSANVIDPSLLPAASPTFDLDLGVFSGESSRVFAPTRTRRSTPTPTPIPEGAITGLAQNLMSTFGLSNLSPTRSYTPLPTLTPTPTGTLTPTPTPTPTSTATATPTETLAPTQTPTPTNTATPTYTPLSTDTPEPLPLSLPIPTPTPTITPLPEYNYKLAEFFNSPTTNSFLLAYVAIVDAREIPVGDLKVVGTRLDHNLTYESPLSTWYYEGYSAPGEIIKSGNVKFEPPGGIETTSWVLHLEDAYGNRQSDDIPFDVDENDKQWYFIKFRRKY